MPMIMAGEIDEEIQNERLASFDGGAGRDLT